MDEILLYLREFNFASVAARLILAMLFGGMLGINRAKKRRAAGFRTYMLVCLGATLAMLLGQYETELLMTHGGELANAVGNRVDVVRFGAQVINGIGFLGAGTVIVTSHQEVKGLTTAAGLWASACAGLAIGAGFYECALVALILMWMCIKFLPEIEDLIIERARNMNIYVEFASMNALGEIISCFKSMDVHIYDVDINRAPTGYHPGAVFSVRLEQWRPHAEILATVSHLENVTKINEV
ncbi:MAG: MgtC/SapB family protein [Oscillospiraceae bacterium]|nr:MgtC/SapB family protein [Oscillospiraceae bacterium]